MQPSSRICTSTTLSHLEQVDEMDKPHFLQLYVSVFIIFKIRIVFFFSIKFSVNDNRLQKNFKNLVKLLLMITILNDYVLIYLKSKRSKFMTFVQAETKSSMNFGAESSHAYTSAKALN